MPHPRVAKEVSIRGPKSIALLFFIACLSALCALWATAQENRLHKNYEEPQGVYRELAAPLHPRTAAKELSFQYFPPGNDAKDTAPSLRNVQILYLDTAKFMSNMAFMAQSLGVQCNYCHDLNDFSSDTLPAKKRAREMIQMVQKLNKNQQQGGINCHTCHQGKTLARAVATRPPKEQKLEAGEPTTAESASPPGKAQQTLPELAGTPERQREADTSSRPPGSAEGWSDDSVQQAIGGKEVIDRLKDRLADRLLSQGADYTEQLGQKKFFGKYFQIDADLRLGKRGLYGDLDILIPLGGTENESAWFLQPGLVLWEDRHGIDREDFSLGLAHRFHPDESAVFGLGGFYDYNADYGHQRLGLSADYQSGAGYLSLNLYKRLSGWKRGRSEDVLEYEESALDGAEFYFDYALTEPLRVQGRASIWKSRLGNRPENTRTGHEIGLAHALWPGVELTANYSRYDDELYDDRWSLGLHLRLPVREQQSSTTFRPDLFRPIERQKRIFTEERVITLALSSPLLRPGMQTVFRDVAFPVTIPALPAQPTADVFVTPDHSGTESVEYSTAGSNGPFNETITLLFTPDNWDQPQTVWVRILPRTARAGSPIDFAVGATEPDTLQNAGGGVLRQVEASSLTITWAHRSEDPRYDGLSSSLTLEVRAPERSTLGFSQASYDVNEADGSVTVEITLNAAAVADVNVTLSTSDGTATAPNDYVALSAQTLTIPASQTSAEFAITIADDSLAEGVEEFTVTISVTGSLPAGVSLGSQSTATVRITDGDTATLAFSAPDYTIAEDAGTLTVAVTLSAAAATDVGFTVSTSDGTASAPADYTAVSARSLTITASQTRVEFPISIADDALVEGAEEFTITISAVGLPAGVSLSSLDTVTVRIVDDNTATLAFSETTYTVAEDAGPLTVAVLLSAQATNAVDFTVSTTDDTATAPGDYTAVSSQALSIAAGQTRVEFPITIANDALIEGNEEFTITISATSLPVGVTLNPAATVQIEDDDSATLAFSEATYTVAENAGPLTVAVVLSAQATNAVDFTVSTTDGTATAPGDYTAVSSQALSIAAGQTRVEFPITIANDALIEGTEEFTITISAVNLPAGVTLDPAATVQIEDDDSATLAFSEATYTVAEDAGPLTVAVVLSAQATNDVDFTVSTTDDTATATGDYTALSNQALSIAAGQTRVEFPITIANDALVEGTEEFTITISAVNLPAGVTLNPAATVQIEDDDSATLAFSEATYTVAEDAGPLTVAVVLSAQATNAVDFTVSTTDDTATATDYTALSNQALSIAAGQTRVEFPITIANDALIEGTEEFTITISAGSLPAGVTLGPAATVQIEDDDSATLAFSETTYTVGENAGTLTVPVILSAAAAADVGFTISTNDGTATEPDDYTAVTAQSLTIMASETSVDLILDISNDDVAEGDEEFTITISAGSLPAGVSLSSLTTVTVRIVDDDMAMLAFPEATYVVAENAGTLTVPIMLSAAAAADVGFTVSTGNDTATAPDDYTAVTAQPLTIMASQTNVDLVLTIADDALAEGAEEFTVTLSLASPPARVSLGSQSTATVRITDDDTATLAFSAPTYTIAEDAGTLTVPVTLSTAAAADVSFTVSTGNGTATEPDDYTAVTAQPLTIMASQTSVDLILEIADDTLVEGTEEFTVTLSLTSPPAGVSLGSQSTATVRITDDDTATLAFSAPTYTIAEDAGTLTVPVTLSAPVAADVGFTVSTGDGTATEPDDYTAVTAQPLTIMASQTSIDLILDIADDALAEGAEEFTVTLSLTSPPAGVSPGSQSTATVRITDDDTATLAFSAPTYTIAEDVGPLTVPVTLSAAAAADVRFTVSTGDGTAIASDDYTAVSAQPLTIMASQTSIDLILDIADDTLAEGAEEFTVTLSLTSPPAGVSLGSQSMATVRITDDDTATLAFSAPTYTIAEDAGPLTVPVTLSTAAAADVSFTVSTGDGTAIASDDYTAVSNRSLTIMASETNVDLILDIADDTLVEGAEEFTVTISVTSLPGGVSLGSQSTATVRITDGDTATLAFSAPAYTVAENAGPLTVPVMLSAPVAADVRFTVSTGNGTATEPDDYTAVTAQPLTIMASQTSIDLILDIADDALVEGAEEFTVTLSLTSPPGGVSPGSQSTATVRITDDDTATLAFSAPTYTIAEDVGPLTVPITLSTAAAADVSFTVSTGNGTATASDDYTAVTAQPLTIMASQTNVDLVLTIADDTLVEGAEEFTVTLSLTSPPAGVSLGSQSTATVRITDDDTATFAFSAPTYTIAEDAGPLTVPVTLSTAAAADVSFTVSTSDGTAIASDDYTAVTAQPLTILASQTNVDLILTIVDDTLVEGAEEFTVTISLTSPPAGVSLGSQSTATVRITDGDTATLAFSEATYAIAENAGPLTVEVLLSAQASNTVDFTVSTTDGTATATADYTALSSRALSIAAGQTRVEFPITIANDDVVEGNEEFTITISAVNLPAGVTLGPAATVQIEDDDTATLAFSEATYTVAEDAGPLTVPIVLSTETINDVSFTVSTDDGTATAPDDYTAISAQTLTILAGQRSIDLVITVADDTQAEGEETFTAAISAGILPGGISLGAQNTATMIIRDDDSSTLSFSETSYMVNENAGTLTVPVILSAPAADVGFTISTNDGTATEPDDYTAVTAQSLTIMASETSVDLILDISNDDVAEGDEEFTITISAGSLPAGVSLSSLTTVTVRIVDDDMAMLAFPEATYVVAENAGTLTVPIMLSAAAAVDVGFTVSTGNGTATEPDDYTAVSAQPLTILASQTNVDLILTIVDDTLVEGAEEFTVTISLTSPPAGVSLGSQSTATVRITDGDTATLAFSEATYAIAENAGPLTVPVTLSTAAAADVSFTVSTGNGTATEPDDYTAVSAQPLTIMASQTNVDLVLTIADDTLVEGAEEFTVTLSLASPPAGVSLGSQSTATVRITDDDTATLAFSAPAYTIAEDAGPLTVPVTLSTAAAADVRFTVSTGDGTATAPDDYTAVTAQPLTIMASETSADLILDIADDTLVEEAEEFTVTISVTGSLPGGVNLGSQSTATVRITDGDTATLAFPEASYTVNEDAGTLTVPVTLSAPAAADVRFTVSTSDGTAIASDDYTAVSAQPLIIMASQTSVDLILDIADDALAEGAEEFTVTLSLTSPPAGVSLGSQNTATVRITDDDTATLAFSAPAYTIAEDAGTLTVPITLSTAAAADVSFTVSTGNGTAIASDDYTAVTAQPLTIMASQTNVDLVLTIADDTLVEGAEEFTVTISLTSPPAGVSLGSQNTATVRITDDDTATLAFSAPTYTIAEDAGPLTVPVTLSTAAAADVRFTVSTGDGTAIASDDYTAVTAQPLTILASQTNVDLVLTIADDTLAEGAEEFMVTISASGLPAGVSLSSLTTVPVRIVDDDTAMLAFTAPNYTIAEDAGTLTVPVTLSTAAAADVSFTVSTGNGTAIASDDYTAVTAQPLTIMASQTNVDLVLTIADDTLVEGAEEFTVTISVTGSLPGGVNLGSQSTATVRITDDDTATFAFSAPTYTIAEDAGTLTVPVTLSAQASNAVDFTVSTGDDTATAPDDYTAVSAQLLTIMASETNVDLVLTIVDDTLVEGAEEFTVTISVISLPGGVSLGSQSTATVRITDDDTATFAFSAPTYTIAEDAGPLTVPVTLSAAAAADVGFTVSTGDGTATAPDDYTAVTAQPLTIMASETSADLILDIADDTLVEEAEEFTVTISVTGSLPGGVNLGSQSTATVRITDGDTATLAFPEASYTVNEDAGTLTVPVTLSAPAAADVRFTVSTSDGTAIASDDYTAVTAQELIIMASQTSVDLILDIADDALAEGAEEFTVTLSLTSPPAGVSLGSQNTATVRITDDDTATLAFSAPAYTIAEDAGTLTVPITLSTAAAADVSFTVSTGNGTAIASDDYTAVTAQPLTIMASQTNVDLVLTIADDTLVEGAEEFTVTISLTSPPAGVSLGSQNTATVRITDDDTAMLAFSAPTYTIAEDAGPLTVPVTLSTAAAADVRFTVSTGDGTATASDDYTAVTAQPLTILASQTNVDLVLTIADDTLAEGAEEFMVTISASGLPAGVSLSSLTTVPVRIVDDDTAMLAFSTATYTIAEDAGTLTVPVTLSTAAAADVSFTVSTGNGTAIASDDYTAVTAQPLTIMASQTNVDLVLTIADDTLVEGAEEFTVTISVTGSLPGGVNLGSQSTATVRITDDDTATFAFSAPTYTIAEDAGTLTVPVTLSAQASNAVDFTVSTGDDTATAPDDYTAVSAQLLTIMASETNVDLVLTIVDDTLVEGAEEFTVTISVISLPGGVSLGSQSTATVRITDDDTAMFAFSAPTYTIAEDAGPLTVPVTLSAAAAADVGFTVSTGDGTATAPDDYTAVSAQLLTIMASETSADLVLTIVDDTLVEGAEEFTLTISVTSLPGGVSLGSQSTAMVRITDGDTATLAFSEATYTIAEDAGTLAVPVVLSAQASNAVGFTVSTTDGTATAPGDYTAVSNQALSIAAGQTRVEFTISIADDSLTEGEESFTVALSVTSPPAGISLGSTASATVTIGDDDMVSIGETTYESRCAGCHAPSNFFGAPALGSASDWSPRIDRGIITLYSSALDGVPGTAMPPFRGSLTADEIEATVDYIVEQSGVTPAPSTADGQTVYNTSCGGCHNTGVLGAPMLGTADWTPRIDRGIITLYDSALDGVPPFMPAFRTSLTADQIEAAVDYIVDQAP